MNLVNWIAVAIVVILGVLVVHEIFYKPLIRAYKRDHKNQRRLHP